MTPRGRKDHRGTTCRVHPATLSAECEVRSAERRLPTTCRQPCLSTSHFAVARAKNFLARAKVRPTPADTSAQTGIARMRPRREHGCSQEQSHGEVTNAREHERLRHRGEPEPPEHERGRLEVDGEA